MYTPISSLSFQSPEIVVPPATFAYKTTSLPDDTPDDIDNNIDGNENTNENDTNDDILPTTATTTQTTTTILIIPKEPEKGITAWLDYMNRNKRQNSLAMMLRNLGFKGL